MSGLGPDARTILESARKFDDPSDEECARVRRSLLAIVAVVGAAPLAAWSTAAAAALKVVLPIALVVAGGAGVWRYARHGSVEVIAPTPKHVSVLASSAGASVSLAPPSPALDVGKGVDAARARHTTAAAPHSRLEEETKLLGQVNETLRVGDPAGAQALLDDYEHRFPAGVLREEMQATRVIARCQAGRSPSAREAARLFLIQHPASPLASRVGGSCDLPGR